ncbi:MAG: hypothetical protein ACRDRK_13825 [Pseudonocardia sp.]
MTASVDPDPDTRYVVGLDIGDGESCLVWLEAAEPEADATIYARTKPVERSVLTALARERGTGAVVFGEAALLIGDAIQFEVNFKRVPTGSLSTPDAVLFAQAFLDEFFQAHPEVRASCYVLVGHPTGWPDTARNDYQRFLQTTDVRLALLPESQSALVHVWDLRRRRLAETGQPYDVDNVLVVDIGSSTVDVTMVTDLDPVNIGAGAELGCRDIDEDLARQSSAALAGDAAFGAAMTAPDAAMMLQLACRRAKEAQFTGQSLMLHDLPGALAPRFRAILGLAAGWLRAQDVPLQVEHRWAPRFRDLLIEVRDKLERPPEVVVLTGGGSRMPITRHVCTEVFPDATMEMDDAPAFSVGRGLASAGRHRLQALRFRRAATGVATIPEVTQALREATVAAFSTLRDNTVQAMRNSDESTWQALIESPPGMEDVARTLEQAVDRTVRPLVDRVCDAYDIPGARRDLGTRLAPPRMFTMDLVNRVKAIPGRPDWSIDDFRGFSPLVARFITQSAAKGAGQAALGAAGIVAKLRGGLKGGGQAALIVGAVAATAAASVWTWKTVERQAKRRHALAELAVMELPADVITSLEQDLSGEIARVVEERVAPLERMVR